MSDEKGRIEKLETQIADIHEGMTDMRSTLELIKIALLGNPEMRVSGVTQKQEAFEKALERYEKKLEKLSDIEKKLTLLKYKAAGFSAGGAGGVWWVLENFF